VLVTISDTAERKRAEEALRESEERYRRLVELSPDGIAVAQAERIVFVNAAMVQLRGAKGPEDIVGRPFIDYVHPESRALVGQQVRQTLAAAETTPFAEASLLRLDGTSIDVELATAPFRYQGQPAVQFVVRDITQRRRAAEMLQKVHGELAHVTRAMTLDELVGAVAHEINQPLAAIVADANASLNWLAEAGPELDRVREALDAIVREGHRAGEVIKRIRQLARKGAPRRHPMDVNDVVHDVLPLVNTELRHQEIALTLDLGSELAPVVGDRIQLQQVILNLVMNAIEAMESVADRPREVVIRTRPHDGAQVLVSIQDTGVGIAAYQVDELFSAFFTTKPDGVGMGLSIARSIVEAHGGRLWAAPNTPHGTIFRFTLPAPRSIASLAPEAPSADRQ